MPKRNILMTEYLPKRQDSDNKPDERCDIR